MIITLSVGLLTHHLVGGGLNYCNKLNSYGTITNRYYTATVGDERGSLGVIAGQDSVCESILGFMGEYHFTKEIGVVVGGYNTNTRAFNEREIDPLNIRGTEITPLVGLNYKISLQETKSYGIVLNNLITPYVISSSVGVRF